MDSNLIKYVPKALRPHVMDAYRDCDGIWIEFDEHVANDLEGSEEYATVHVDTIAELRSDIKMCHLV